MPEKLTIAITVSDGNSDTSSQVEVTREQLQADPNIFALRVLLPAYTNALHEYMLANDNQLELF